MSGQQLAPAALYPRERPGTHYTGDLVGPRAGLDGRGKSRPHRDSIPDRPARSQVTTLTELPGPQIIDNTEYILKCCPLPPIQEHTEGKQ